MRKRSKTKGKMSKMMNRTKTMANKRTRKNRTTSTLKLMRTTTTTSMILFSPVHFSFLDTLSHGRYRPTSVVADYTSSYVWPCKREKHFFTPVTLSWFPLIHSLSQAGVRRFPIITSSVLPPTPALASQRCLAKLLLLYSLLQKVHAV